MKQLFFLVLLMIIVGVDACRCFGGKKSSKSSKKSKTTDAANDIKVDDTIVLPATAESTAIASEFKDAVDPPSKKSEEKSK